MDSNFLFGISLTASFLAGVLALFAPCCITFLFPSYLGTVFKEGKKVMFYTLIFALGLSVILVPIAIGFRFFVFFLDSFHKQIYYLGALVLIGMGLATVRPFFSLPSFFHFQPKLGQKVNTGSVFGLGLMSGLTSSCCAPVLFAAVTLTALSPTLFQAVVVSLAYVLGIVFPLFLLSLFYGKLTSKIAGQNRQKIYNIFRSLGAAVFIASGLFIAVLNFQNKIQAQSMSGYGAPLRLFIFGIAQYFRNPFLDLGTFLLIIFVFYKLLSFGIKDND
ncbi:MAG: hypothetical protein M1352_00645 [Patescibacteria group bacterium]|nr:hypothetical protein [Patescibacteria group bacterium]